MKNRILYVLTAVSVLFTLCGSTSYAFQGTRIEGNIESSKVEIKVNLDDEKGTVDAGQTVKEHLTIDNQGSECYVRVTPRFTLGEDETRVFTDWSESNFLGMPPGWVNKNGVFYFTGVIGEGESILFCENLSIPENIESGNLDIEFSVDALQSANLVPDFLADSPWGEVEVAEVYARNRGYKVNLVKGSYEEAKDMELHYNDDAKKLISNFDEIFRDMPRMHPGDSFTEVINLHNPTKETKTLYLSDVADDSEILKYVEMKVETRIDGELRTVYKGSITDTSSMENGLLAAGTLDPGESGELMVSAYMDEGAGNEAADLSGHVALSMDAATKGEVLSADEKGTNIRSAKTGDNSDYGRALIVMGMFVAVGTLMLRKRGWSEN